MCIPPLHTMTAYEELNAWKARQELTLAVYREGARFDVPTSRLVEAA